MLSAIDLQPMPFGTLLVHLRMQILQNSYMPGLCAHNIQRIVSPSMLSTFPHICISSQAFKHTSLLPSANTFCEYNQHGLFNAVHGFNGKVYHVLFGVQNI